MYFCEAQSYKKMCGVWPSKDPSKSELLVSHIAALKESPSRLPPRFANQMYFAGETGMEYCQFELTFSDGSNQTYGTGNLVDFLEWLKGRGPNDVVAIKPHAVRNWRKKLTGENYHWCLFTIEPSQNLANGKVGIPMNLRERALRPELVDQLSLIEPSLEGYPCSVRLIGDRVLSCVYLKQYKGDLVSPSIDILLDQDRVNPEDIQAISESPFRLPARIADELYMAGESGMGYFLFTVVFRDGLRQPYLTGSWLDFLDYPAGRGPQDVARVLPHRGHRIFTSRNMGVKEFHCCYFGGPDMPRKEDLR